MVLSRSLAVSPAKAVASHFRLAQSWDYFPEMQSWMLRGMHLSHGGCTTPKSREHGWQEGDTGKKTFLRTIKTG